MILETGTWKGKNSVKMIQEALNYADKKGIEFVIMIGEDEMKSGKISVKDMDSGKQTSTTIVQFIKDIT